MPFSGKSRVPIFLGNGVRSKNDQKCHFWKSRSAYVTFLEKNLGSKITIFRDFCTGSYLGFWSKNHPFLARFCDFGGPEIELTCGAKFGQICDFCKNGSKTGTPKNGHFLTHFLGPPKRFFQVAKILKGLSYEFQHFCQNRSKGEKNGVIFGPPKTRNLTFLAKKWHFLGVPQFLGVPKKSKKPTFLTFLDFFEKKCYSRTCNFLAFYVFHFLHFLHFWENR